MDDLRDLYRDKPLVLKKLDSYLRKLPRLLETYDARLCERTARAELEKTQVQANIKYLLSANQWYYITSTNQYVTMAPECSLISEDNLSHHIYSNVDSFKRKTTEVVLRLIRQQTLFEKGAPTPNMVRRVYKWLASVFSSTKVAKYFTAVVGDILLGKRENIYFIDRSFKPFLAVLSHEITGLTNRTILDHFKHKYYDHQYSKCRVIPGKAKSVAIDARLTLTFLTVAAALARRGDPDDQLDAPLARAVRILHNSSPSELIQRFLCEYTSPAPGATIPYKHLYYMWRHFLSRNYLPFVVTQHNFKHILKELGLLDDDKCLNLATLYKPTIINFEQFWEMYMTPSDSEYTIQEIVDLYNSWCDTKTLHIAPAECAQWIAESGHDLAHLNCRLWDKTVDIENAMETFKYSPSFALDLDVMYAFYFMHATRVNKMVADIDYFKRYMTRRGLQI